MSQTQSTEPKANLFETTSKKVVELKGTVVQLSTAWAEACLDAGRKALKTSAEALMRAACSLEELAGKLRPAPAKEEAQPHDAAPATARPEAQAAA